jgi:hypothetical protein
MSWNRAESVLTALTTPVRTSLTVPCGVLKLIPVTLAETGVRARTSSRAAGSTDTDIRCLDRGDVKVVEVECGDAVDEPTVHVGWVFVTLDCTNEVA